MTVNKERVELLCQALESDQYVQCKDALRTNDGFPCLGSEITFTYCALGVAIEVAVRNGLFVDQSRLDAWYDIRSTLPSEVRGWYGFVDNNPEIIVDDDRSTVADANDVGFDFWTISQAIRATYLKDQG
jgi:hypothetical protein